MYRITRVLLCLVLLGSHVEASQRQGFALRLPGARQERIEPELSQIRVVPGTASPVYVPAVRENSISLIDSSYNGYGLMTGEPNPLSWDPDNGRLVAAYRRWAGAGSGVLGAATSEDDGQTYTTYTNINQGTVFQAGRYPSAFATPDYPIVVWNEYGGGGGVQDGRAFYSYDQGGYGAGQFTAPTDIHNNPTANDLWQGTPAISYANDGSMYLNTVFADWTAPRNKYLFRTSTNGAWDGTALTWESPYQILDMQNDFLSTATANYVSNGVLDINDAGVGYFVVSGYWQDTTAIHDHTLFIKQTLDYGATWSEWIHISDQIMDTYFRTVIPDSILNDYDQTWVTLPSNWTPFATYDLDVITDDAGGCHIIAGVLPSASGGVYPGWSEECGLYHFYSPQNDLSNWEINFVGSLRNAWLLNDPGWQNVFPNFARDTELDNTLYATWYNWPDMNAPVSYFDIFAAYSIDNGATWSAPINLTNTTDDTFNEIDPHLARRAANGTIKLLFQVPDYNVPTVNPPSLSEDYKNLLYVMSYDFFEDSEIDLVPGSTCADWENAIVIGTTPGEFSTDGVTEPLEPGQYYINSVIQNTGTIDAVFGENQSVWKVYLDGQEIQNWGGTTNSILQHRITPEQFYWRWQNSREIDNAGRMQAGNQNTLTGQSEPLRRMPVSTATVDNIPHHQPGIPINTQVDTREIIFQESFETWPNGWLLNDTFGDGETWFQTDLSAYSGVYSASVTSQYEFTMQGLRSPIIDLSDYSGETVALTFFQRDDYAGSDVYHEVDIWANGMVEEAYELMPPTTNWEPITIDLSDYAGMSNVQIEFYYLGDYPDVWYVDQVQLVTSSTSILPVVPAGTCMPGFSSNPVYLESGNHELRVETDPDHVLAELDETNNSYTRTISVNGPNLPGNLEWSHSFGALNAKNAYAVLPTADNGLLTLTYTDNGSLYNDWDAQLIKTDAQGNVIWSQTYGGDGDDLLYSIAATPDGGYIMAGMTTSIPTANYNGWVVKVDANGEELWNHNYDGNTDQLFLIDALPYPNGGYILTGYGHFLGTTTTSMDGWVGIVTETGDLFMSQHYGTDDDEFIYSIHPTIDGGYLLVGDQASEGWLIKIGATLNPIWEYAYGGIGIDRFNHVLDTPDGGFLVSGSTTSIGAGDVDGWIVRVDGNGGQLWERAYGTLQTDWFNSMTLAHDGSILLAGNTESLTQDSIHIYLARIDWAGNKIWDHIFTELDNYYISWPQTVCATVDGGYAIAGGNNGFSYSDNFAWVGKLRVGTGVGPSFNLSQPIAGTTITTLTPTFSWESADSLVTSYTLSLGSSSEDIMTYDLGSVNQIQLTNPLPDNTIYRWHVTAHMNNGATFNNLGGNQTFAVNIANDPPEPAALITPTPNSVEVTTTPNFYWEISSDPDPGESLSYRLWLSRDIEFEDTDIYEMTDHTYTPETELIDNSEYYWKIETTDSPGANAETNPARFWVNTVLEPPNAFTLLSPPNFANGLTQTPDFIWATASDNDPRDYSVYTILIATDSLFLNIVTTVNALADTSFTITNDLSNNAQYWWKVIAVDTDSLTTESPVHNFTVGYVSTDPETALPTEYALHANYPNPFNPSTTIKYDLPEAGLVHLTIYNQLGQPIRTLISREEAAGFKSIIWDGRNERGKQVSTGIYLYRMRVNEFSQTKKMILMK